MIEKPLEIIRSHLIFQYFCLPKQNHFLKTALLCPLLFAPQLTQPHPMLKMTLFTGVVEWKPSSQLWPTRR